jgi:hypothetical protein
LYFFAPSPLGLNLRGWMGKLDDMKLNRGRRKRRKTEEGLEITAFFGSEPQILLSFYKFFQLGGERMNFLQKGGL